MADHQQPSGEFLNASAIEKLRGLCPSAGLVRVGRFYECYDILLNNAGDEVRAAWNETKQHISKHNSGAEFGPDSLITRKCLRDAVSGEAPNWAAVFLLTMIWGFGGTNQRVTKDGPAKLFRAVRTESFSHKITHVAEAVQARSLWQVYDAFCLPEGEWKLDEIADSFGTKFLFAAGMRLDPEKQPVPLVLDSRVRDALKVFGAPKFEQNGCYYQRYCEGLARAAKQLGNTPYDIEQVLFETKRRPRRR